MMSFKSQHVLQVLSPHVTYLHTELAPSLLSFQSVPSGRGLSISGFVKCFLVCLFNFPIKPRPYIPDTISLWGFTLLLVPSAFAAALDDPVAHLHNKSRESPNINHLINCKLLLVFAQEVGN